MPCHPYNSNLTAIKVKKSAHTLISSAHRLRQINGYLWLALISVMAIWALATQAIAKEAPPTPVNTLNVNTQNIPLFETYPGRTEAVKEITVQARVTGILEKKRYQDGQTVQKGQILYQIDDRRYQALVAQARAQVNMEQAKLKQAEREYNRVQGLYANKAVSAQEVDSAQAELELSKAGLLGAKATLNNAQIDLDYTQVKAEISGVTGAKQQDIGNLVGTQPNNSVLTTVTQLDPIYAVLAIPDNQRLAQRQQVQAGKIIQHPITDWQAHIVDVEGHTLAKGKVDFVDTKINQNTGGVKVRTIFDNLNSGNKEKTLMPGEFVQVKLFYGVRKNVFRIPQSAVVQKGQQSFVYVVKENQQAQLIPIQGLHEYQGDWLVESGLNNGDQVIISNLMKVRPNAQVNPNNQNATKSANASQQ